MFDVADKAFFITGGTSGIGLATATRLRRAGGRVALVGRRADGAALAADIGATFLGADVSDEAQLRDAFDAARATLGPLHGIFNNAGIQNTGPLIEEADAAELQRLVDVNFTAAYNVLRHGAAHLADGGAVVNTSSLAATLSLPGYAQYAATKAALNALTRSAALELAPRRIRVNAVCPGSIWSEMLPPDHPEVDLVRVVCPLERVGEPEEVAALVHYLMSDDARYVTGALIPIDGGVSAGLGLPLLTALSNLPGEAS